MTADEQSAFLTLTTAREKGLDLPPPPEHTCPHCGREADIDDECQSVQIVRIGATATSEGGGKTVTGDAAVIVDEVAYEGLTPGETYKLQATLMDSETGEPVRCEDGLSPAAATAEAEFIAETADGKASVMLECDVKELGGHKLVVFEELFTRTAARWPSTKTSMTRGRP